MTDFAFTNIVAPINSTVVATLTAPDGVTVVATLTLAATSSGATTYSGSMGLVPTPADSATPYTFGITSTNSYGTIPIFPPGSVYGYLYLGEWFDVSTPTVAPGETFVTGRTVDDQGNTAPSAVATFRVKYQTNPITATSDSEGNLSITLLQNTEYAWATPAGSSNYFTTPASTTLNIGNMIGDWST